MMDAINSLAKLVLELTKEERNLLLVGYKKVAISKCKSLNLLLVSENVMFHSSLLKIFQFIMLSICPQNLIIGLPFAFRKGDYYRYLAEFKMEPEKSKVID
jgi:hypothetical protein